MTFSSGERPRALWALLLYVVLKFTCPSKVYQVIVVVTYIYSFIFVQSNSSTSFLDIEEPVEKVLVKPPGSFLIVCISLFSSPEHEVLK